MNPNTEIIIPFYEDRLVTVQGEDGVYVAMKPICEALGIDLSNNLKRLKGREKVICVVNITTQVGSQGRSLACIPLSRLAFWLALLNPNSVSEQIKPKLERYQRECADKLDRHFRKLETAHEKQFERLAWHMLASNPAWMKIYSFHKAGVDRSMVFRHLRKSFEATVALIEEMEKCGVIDPAEWGDNSDEPSAAVYTDRTVRKAYENGYRDVDGESRPPSRRTLIQSEAAWEDFSGPSVAAIVEDSAA